MGSVTTSVRRALSRLDDERLARLSAGDRVGAFATLYARHHQALYRYCATIVGEDADAQDALQATWLRALVALRRGQRDAPLRPWLFRIAHNESISILRRRARAREPVLIPAGPPPTAEEGMLARERFSQLVDDLHGLPDRARSAIVLRELTGLSHEEIAGALDITVGAAKQSVYEARRGLQDEARGRAMACPEIQGRISDGDRRVMRGRAVRAHLRQCPDCTAFAQAIGDRSASLGAFVPTLALASSGAILRQVAGATGTTTAGATTAGGIGGAAGTTGATGAATKALGAGLLAKSLAATGAVVTAAGVTVAISADQPQTHHFRHRAPSALVAAMAATTSTSDARPAVVTSEAARATIGPRAAAGGHGRAGGRPRPAAARHGTPAARAARHARPAAAHRHAHPGHGRSGAAHAAHPAPEPSAPAAHPARGSSAPAAQPARGNSAAAPAAHPARGRSAVAHAAQVARGSAHGRSGAAHTAHPAAAHGKGRHPTATHRGSTSGHRHPVLLPASSAPAHGRSAAAHAGHSTK
jgi:RNA polymerase sigma factor (sigma-70 family)